MDLELKRMSQFSNECYYGSFIITVADLDFLQARRRYDKLLIPIHRHCRQILKEPDHGNVSVSIVVTQRSRLLILMSQLESQVDADTEVMRLRASIWTRWGAQDRAVKLNIHPYGGGAEAERTERALAEQ